MSATMNRVYNFSAGPSMLPLEVLEEAKRDLLNFDNSGMSVMEMSHRGKHFVRIYDETVGTLRELLSVPQSHHLIFGQGGATLQFSSIPLNLLSPQNSKADYLVTGSWGQLAYAECEKYGTPSKACDTKSSNYTFIPDSSEWKLDEGATFLHYCANETIYGVEFKDTPNVPEGVKLVSDMSSNFCSKPIEVSKHAVIYAGVQKNLGPAGAAVMIIEDSLLGNSQKCCPTLCDFATLVKGKSAYNTPPCWTIYMCGLAAKYLKRTGGMEAWKEKNEKKAQMLYDVIDSSDGGYYECPTQSNCRSCMNIPFRVGKKSEELEKKFISEAEKSGLSTLAGHRTVGGCRASLYNGMPIEGVEKLCDFMKSFQDANPSQS